VQLFHSKTEIVKEYLFVYERKKNGELYLTSNLSRAQLNQTRLISIILQLRITELCNTLG